MAVVGLSIVMTALTAVAPPAQAATRALQPTASCTNVSGAYGRITVHHGLQPSGGQAEYVGVAYTIQRWNSSTGSWYNYTSHSYVGTVYPPGQIELPPVHTVHDGYYRVYLSLAWYENGTLQSWAGWVPIYNQVWGSYYAGYCTV